MQSYFSPNKPSSSDLVGVVYLWLILIYFIETTVIVWGHVLYMLRLYAVIFQFQKWCIPAEEPTNKLERMIFWKSFSKTTEGHSNTDNRENFYMLTTGFLHANNHSAGIRLAQIRCLKGQESFGLKRNWWTAPKMITDRDRGSFTPRYFASETDPVTLVL